MLILHNEFKPEIRPGESIGYPSDKPPAVNPLLSAEAKQEDCFEKALADPETPTPFHMNVYVRTFLGAVLFLSLIAFYVTHISGQGSLGTYGQATNPPVITNH
jgi:hypothetical protein